MNVALLGTKKTKEGTFASILCEMIAILMLMYLGKQK
jgi:hypothetical protein